VRCVRTVAAVAMVPPLTLTTSARNGDVPGVACFA